MRLIMSLLIGVFCMGSLFSSLPVSFHIFTKHEGENTRQVVIIGVDYGSDGSAYVQPIHDVVSRQRGMMKRWGNKKIDFLLDVQFPFDHKIYNRRILKKMKLETHFSCLFVSQYLRSESSIGPFYFRPIIFDEEEKINVLFAFLMVRSGDQQMDGLNDLEEELGTIGFYKDWFVRLEEAGQRSLGEYYEHDFFKKKKNVLKITVELFDLLGNTHGFDRVIDSAVRMLGSDENRRKVCGKLYSFCKHSHDTFVPFLTILNSQKQVENTIAVLNDENVAKLGEMLCHFGYKKSPEKRTESCFSPYRLKLFLSLCTCSCGQCGASLKKGSFSDRLASYCSVACQKKTVSRCAWCGKGTKFRCSKCKRVMYCGEGCQKNDWPDHKRFCS